MEGYRYEVQTIVYHAQGSTRVSRQTCCASWSLCRSILAKDDTTQLMSAGGGESERNENCIKVVYCLPSKIFDQYINDAIVKTVCEAKSKIRLLKANTMTEELGLVEGEDFGLIYDKCRTELEPEEEDGTTLTGMWFRPLPDETTHQISKKYHLYM